jgi:hypothetical protein
VISRSFASDTSGDRLAVFADDAELLADGADATRVVFRAVDRYGAPRPFVDGDVTLKVDGPGRLVGESPFDFAEAGGAGAAWVRTFAGATGTVRLRAEHPTLGAGEVNVDVRPAPGVRPGAAVDMTLAATPAMVRRGTTARVTASLSNRSHPALTDVELALAVPAGWSAAASGPTRFASVEPDHSVRAAWDVTVPAGADPGDATLTVRAAYRAAGRSATSVAAATLGVAGTLEDALNNAGTSDDSDVLAADFDGSGNSYSRQALAALGLAPGAQFVHDGIAFTWPSAPAGQPDNALCHGQAIAVSGTGSRLAFLGASSDGPLTGTGTIHYADGTRGEFELILADYFLAPGEGKNGPAAANEVVAHMTYLNASTKKGDGGHPGRRTHDVYVVVAAVPIEAKPVAGVTLPDASASTSGPDMHVFAIGIG